MAEATPNGARDPRTEARPSLHGLREAVSRLRPEELPGRTRRLLGHRGTMRALVRLVDLDGRRVIVKDLAAIPAWVRPLWGRYQAGREARIYRQLEGIRGVPAFLGTIGPLAFAIEFVEGRMLHPDLSEHLTGDFFERLDGLIEKIHARGVAHLDLRQRQNVLLDEEGLPWIIDFGGAIRAPWLGPLARVLYAIDRTATLKWKVRYAPGLLQDGEARTHRRIHGLTYLWPGRYLKWIVGRARQARERPPHPRESP